MKIQTILYSLCMVTFLSSCHIYQAIRPTGYRHKGLYRDPVAINDTLVSDTNNMADLPWEKVFTDPYLQSLIRLGLERNVDLQTALLKVTGSQSELDDFADCRIYLH